MPRDVDIQPGGAFHLPAAQQANMENLLKIFGKKEATDALKALAKTDKTTWTKIKDVTSDLNEIVSAGGTGAVVRSFEDTINLQIEQLLSSLKNEINQLITDALTPINAIVTDIFNELGRFVAENKVGAGIGGIVGSIAAMFLPGGPLLTAIGAIIGAGIEQLISILEPGVEGSRVFGEHPIIPGEPFTGADRTPHITQEERYHPERFITTPDFNDRRERRFIGLEEDF